MQAEQLSNVFGSLQGHGKGDIKESSASRTLNANSGDEQARETRIPRAALFSPVECRWQKRVAWFSLLSGQRELQGGVLSEPLIKELETAKVLRACYPLSLFMGMPRFCERLPGRLPDEIQNIQLNCEFQMNTV